MTLLDSPSLPMPVPAALAAVMEISYLRPLLESLPDHLKSALDVGAHKGDFTEALTDLGFKVLAVEPQDYMADRFAKRHAHLIRDGAVTLARCAASDHHGHADLIIGSASTVSTLEVEWTSVAFPEEFRSPRTVRVPLAPLADLVRQQDFGPVGFAKIDVEGHELRALSGLFGPRIAPPPIVMFEANQRFPEQAVECLALLRSQGYQTFDIFIRIGLDPVAAERLTAVQLPKCWRAYGDRYFYANIIAYHQSLSFGGSEETAETVRNADPASEREMNRRVGVLAHRVSSPSDATVGEYAHPTAETTPAITRDTETCDGPDSLSPVLGGEGWGEGPFWEQRNSTHRPSPYPSPPSTGERGPAKLHPLAQCHLDPIRFVKDYRMQAARDVLQTATESESRHPVPVHPIWQTARLKLRDYLLTQDWHEFLRHPTCKEMFVRGRWTAAQDRELETVERSNFGRDLLEKLRDPDVGSPRCSERLPGISTNLLGMIWYLTRIHQQAGGTLPGRVVEVGGGYGALAYAYSCAAPDTEYVIVDLPEMLAIQYYFLTLALPDRQIVFAQSADAVEPAPGRITLVPISHVGQMNRNAKTCDGPNSLSPVLGGEGWGEGPFCGQRNSKHRPSPYPSPPSTGERGAEKPRRLAQGQLSCELLISTFALSEMPRELQRQIEERRYFDATRIFITGQLSTEFPEIDLVSHSDIVGAAMQRFTRLQVERFHISDNYLLMAERVDDQITEIFNARL